MAGVAGIVPGNDQDGRQTPPGPIVIYDEMAGVAGIVPENDQDGRHTPPGPIVIDDELEAFPGIIQLNDEDGRQTPPGPIDIDDGIPEFLEIARNNNDEPQIHGPHPPPEAIGRRPRNRQKRKKKVAHEPVAPVQPAIGRKKNKNKRRLEMRKNAALREQVRREEIEELRSGAADAALLRIEAAWLQAQLDEAHEQIRSAREDAMCLMCRNNVATHAYLGCGHRLACAGCAQKLWDMPLERGRYCPLCTERSTVPPQRIYQGGE